MKQETPYVGTEDFEELRNNNDIFIDKTEFLSQLFGERFLTNEKTYKDKVLLFTRPRRFGKTLTMSMIKNFFELNYADPKDKSETEKLFNNLAIMKDKSFCERHMGEYPVICISLKGVSGSDYIEALTSLFNIIGDLYKDFEFLKDLNLASEDYSKLSRIIKLAKDGNTIKFSDPDVMNNVLLLVKSSLRDLTSYLYSVYKRKTIVIVDEYDVPLQKAQAGGYYNNMLNVLRGMFESVFKTNNYLERGFVTGCLRISHESIFTGINNFSIYTTNDEAYNSFIGFTHDETVQLLKNENLSLRENDVMEWYDGYNFAGARMLCPWSVLNFCTEARESSDPVNFAPHNYWVNSSGNDIVDICITKPNAKDSMRLQNLLKGDSEIIKETEFTSYPEISIKTGFDIMMGLMLHTGYLTVKSVRENGDLEVKIPNKEITDCFRKRIELLFSDNNTQWFEKAESLKNSLFKNEKDEVQALINELLINFVSVRNTANESYYHGFLAGILSITLDENTEIKSDKESGNGFSDLTLVTYSKKIAIIIEFKKLEKGENFDDVCSEALKQIEDKKYAYPYEQKGYTIIKYGIGFLGKECMVKSAN